MNTQANELPNMLGNFEVSAPSIASSAMLVDVSISQWAGQRKDVGISNEVTNTKNAEKGTAKVTKKLLPTSQRLKAIETFVTAVRSSHKAITMPWSNNGLRLLPTTVYFDYHNQMSAYQMQFAQLVDDFLNGYDDDIIEAQLFLGDMFDISNYPTREDLMNKFQFRLSYIPLPESGDFRVDIGNDAIGQVKSAYQSYYTEQVQNAMNDIWHRLYEVLARMSERLDYKDNYVIEQCTSKDGKVRNKRRNVDAKKFHDTLVSNVVEMTEIMQKLNVTNDSRMSAMALKLQEAMHGITPDALREDEFTRLSTKSAVDDIINDLPSLDF